MKKVIRDLPQRDINELNAAQQYLFGTIPVIGESLMFTRIIAQMEMPPLPRLMTNKAQREALETTIFTRIRNVIKQQWDLVIEAVEQERNKAFLPFKGYTITNPLPGEYIDKSPLSYAEFKQLCV